MFRHHAGVNPGGNHRLRRVGYAAAAIPAAAVGRFGDRVRQEPAAGRFHCGQREAGLDQRRAHRHLRRFVIVAPDVRRQPPVNGILYRRNHGPRRPFVPGAGDDPQVDAVGLGINAQIGVFQAEVFGDDFVHRGFAQPQRLDVAGNRHLIVNQRFQSGVNFVVPHCPVFAGRAGHTDDMLAVFRGPPAGGGAVAVDDELRRGYQVRLLDIVGRHILAPVAEPLAQVFQLRRLHRRRFPQGGGYRFPRQVVLRGPQPAGGKDDVGAFHPLPKSVGQPGQVVPDDAYPLQPDAQGRQPAGNPAGVGVGQFAHQQLGADGNNFGLHGN